MLRSTLRFSSFYKGIHQVRFSSTQLVDLSVNNNGIATVTMQRKPVNGLNLELMTELCKSFDQVENEKARGMILTSNLGTIFTAGLDIMEMYQPDPERLRKFWMALQDIWLKLNGMGIPTAAVINGHSPAGGCLLAMSCEYRVMVKNYTIGLNETKVGMVAPEWCVASMKNTISNRQSELALTSGTLFSTEEAFSIGLIDEIANDKTEAIAKTDKFFERFRKINPLARQMTKTAFRKQDIMNLMDNREKDVEQFVSDITQPQAQEALGKYVQGLKKKA